MSFVTRRALSTLIPPKVASPKLVRLGMDISVTLGYVGSAIGGAPDALRMQRVVSFYEKLPRGAVPEAKAKGLLGRYQAKYFGKKTSVQPIIHVLALLIGIGYAQNYYFHLRHHKNNAH
ncbi:mitochondrial F1F0 ATP synthase subunit F Atp17 [Metarhizium guizhouense ARSEF 977]|uniref:Mitochondrial F1F0 ATP synthase subunit F Atp17 n=1 Tax=Metarhizium guizhouense (strain ARSEF 977) TaxID=1276136 RepID=A0A0B4H9I5_METGA|nr:mitochondrial F1F0 ATP synthase subunit F Atp17 [Metarhizium guizhouense ARSEF 977]